jgi:hypothetical protein
MEGQSWDCSNLLMIDTLTEEGMLRAGAALAAARNS